MRDIHICLEKNALSDRMLCNLQPANNLCSTVLKI